MEYLRRPSEDTRQRLRHHSDMREAFRGSLDSEQLRGVRAYTVISPRTMNNVAGEDAGLVKAEMVWRLHTKGHHRRSIAALQSALMASPRLDQVEGVPATVTIYRGVWDLKDIRKGRADQVLPAIQERLPVGGEVNLGTEHRFNSWSLLPSVALSFTHHRRRVPVVLRMENHHMCNYHGSDNLAYSEADFIMPLGSRYRVLGHSIQELPLSRGRRPRTVAAVVVDVEWLHPGGPWSDR